MSTERPITLRVLRGVELFACTRIPAELSRRACAARFVAVVGAGRSAISQTIDQGPCRGCPIGALHESEEHVKGSTTRTSMPLAGRTPRRVIPPTSASAPIVAPAAVVPRKPPARLSAGAQTVATPDDGIRVDVERESASQGPAEIELPAPPTGEQVSAGHVRAIRCERCSAYVVPTNNRQRWCVPCRPTPAEQAAVRKARESVFRNAVTIEHVRAARRAERVRAAGGAVDVPANGYRRGGRLLTVGGVTLSVAGWARRMGCRDTVLFERLARGWSPARAVNTPVGAREETRDAAE